MKTILVLEDEDGIRDVLNVLLSIEGYRVIESSSINDFNLTKGIHDADLYMLDVRLPDGSGIDVFNSLKCTHNVPVILMSAHAKTCEIEKSCNPEAFVSKPFDIDELLAKVRILIGPA